MSTFNTSDIVTPIDLDKVYADTLLSDTARATIKAVEGKGVINQIKQNEEKENLNYVNFIDKELNWITQVFKDNEIKKVGN